MKRYIVDRFEGDFIVLEKEEGGITDIKKSLLPDAKKGDIVIENDGVYFVDKEATKKRKAFMMEKNQAYFRQKMNIMVL